MMSTSSQPALLEVEDDLSLPADRVRHAFTGEQLERREQLREAITLLLAAGVPVDTISSRVGVSNHTVMVLRDRLYESVADQKKDFAQVCLSKGAKFLGIAESMAHRASFKDLMIGFGIATQRGTELLAMGSGAEGSEAKAIDVESARARVERLLADAPAVLDASPVEAVSSVSPIIGGTSGAAVASHDAGRQPPGPGSAPPGDQGAGGVGQSKPPSDDDVSQRAEIIGKGEV